MREAGWLSNAVVEQPITRWRESAQSEKAVEEEEEGRREWRFPGERLGLRWEKKPGVEVFEVSFRFGTGALDERVVVGVKRLAISSTLPAFPSLDI